MILGVFIALAAQQAFDDWKDRRDVAAFRQAVDAELGENLAAYEQRVRQGACAKARLDQLEAWQRDWRDGAGPVMIGRIHRPIGYTLRNDVWQTGADSVVGKMPLKERLTYAGLYSGLATYDNLRLREAAIWQQLYAYDQAQTLSEPEVNALRGLILSARALGSSIDGNWQFMKNDAARIGVAVAPYEFDDASMRICGTIAFK